MNTIASYRDILVNGVKCDEVLTTTKEVYVPKIITNCLSYDEYTYENLLKTVKEFTKKYNLKSFLIREDEIMFFEIDENNYKNFLLKTNCQLHNPGTIIEFNNSVVSSFDGVTEWNQNGYNFNTPYCSTYNCSYSFAQSINNKNKLVKIFWCTKDNCALFYSVLPQTIHDLIVKTFFSDVDIKFSPNNYNRVNNNNSKSNIPKQIVDDDGFIHTKPRKISKKMIDRMQQNELAMMVAMNNNNNNNNYGNVINNFCNSDNNNNLNDSNNFNNSHNNNLDNDNNLNNNISDNKLCSNNLDNGNNLNNKNSDNDSYDYCNDNIV